MSEAKGRCLFDKSKECPVRAVTELEDLLNLGKVYCPICPIRAELMKGEGSFE